MFLRADSEDARLRTVKTGQTGQTPRLICLRWVCMHVILLFLLCSGSHMQCKRNNKENTGVYVSGHEIYLQDCVQKCPGLVNRHPG